MAAGLIGVPTVGDKRQMIEAQLLKHTRYLNNGTIPSQVLRDDVAALQWLTKQPDHVIAEYYYVRAEQRTDHGYGTQYTTPRMICKIMRSSHDTNKSK